MREVRTGVIYKIENLANGKVYIGQTLKKPPKRRWDLHRSRLNRNKHENDYLQSAWNKYGEESFRFSIICEADVDELDKLETYYIDFFRRQDKCYNLESGGNLLKEVHPATRAKISALIKRLHEQDDDYRRQYLEVRARPVICIDTGIIYPSLKEASRSLGINWTAIQRVCSGHMNSARGKDGHYYQLAYYEEGKTYQLKKLRNIKTPKPVICVNTGEIFGSMHEAAKKMNISQGHISQCCHGKRRHAGKTATGEFLVWRFLEDYDPAQDYTVVKTGKHSNHKHKVRCVATGEVFDTMKQACEAFGVSRTSLWRACTGRINGVRLKTGEILRFEYA